jgi:hypothetical protein
VATKENQGEEMLENILTIIVVLIFGAIIGIGVIFAILWMNFDKD